MRFAFALLALVASVPAAAECPPPIKGFEAVVARSLVSLCVPVPGIRASDTVLLHGFDADRSSVRIIEGEHVEIDAFAPVADSPWVVGIEVCRSNEAGTDCKRGPDAELTVASRCDLNGDTTCDGSDFLAFLWGYANAGNECGPVLQTEPCGGE